MTTLRVLIADPDDTLLETYAGFLADYGVQVAVATNGLDCVERLRDSRPEVMVLGSGLLWGGAAGVLEWMYAELSPPKVPVILLADASDADRASRASEFPIDVFMMRPVRPHELLERIRRARGYTSAGTDNRNA